MTLPRFGVELETVGEDREKVARTIAKVVHGSIDPASKNGDVVVRDLSTMRYWHVVEDGSLSMGGAEIVSPILGERQGDDEIVPRIARTIADELKATSSPDRSCGIHVHVDANNLDRDGVAAVVRCWSGIEAICLSLFTSDLREETSKPLPEVLRAVMYCLPDKSPGQYDDEIEEAFAHIVYTALQATQNTGIKYNDARYHALNLHSWFYTDRNGHRRKTLEFRLFDGTLDPDKIWLYQQIARLVVYRGAGGARPVAQNVEEFIYLLTSWGLDEARVRRATGVFRGTVDELQTRRLILTETLNGLADEIVRLKSISTKLQEEEKELLRSAVRKNEFSLTTIQDKLLDNEIAISNLLKKRLDAKTELKSIDDSLRRLRPKIHGEEVRSRDDALAQLGVLITDYLDIDEGLELRHIGEYLDTIPDNYATLAFNDRAQPMVSLIPTIKPDHQDLMTVVGGAWHRLRKILMLTISEAGDIHDLRETLQTYEYLDDMQKKQPDVWPELDFHEIEKESSLFSLQTSPSDPYQTIYAYDGEFELRHRDSNDPWDRWFLVMVEVEQDDEE